MFDLDLALTMPEDSSSALEINNLSTATARDPVEEMPTVVLGGDGAGPCAVCMDGFHLEAGKIVPACAHVFHQNCISRWLSLHNSCPLCRRNISAAGN